MWQYYTKFPLLLGMCRLCSMALLNFVPFVLLWYKVLFLISFTYTLNHFKVTFIIYYLVASVYLPHNYKLSNSLPHSDRGLQSITLLKYICLHQTQSCGLLIFFFLVLVLSGKCMLNIFSLKKVIYFAMFLKMFNFRIFLLLSIKSNFTA